MDFKLKHNVTMTSFTADFSEIAGFPYLRMCQIDSSEDIENLSTMLSIVPGHDITS